jgi:hypothetical protein
MRNCYFFEFDPATDRWSVFRRQFDEVLRVAEFYAPHNGEAAARAAVAALNGETPKADETVKALFGHVMGCDVTVSATGHDAGMQAERAMQFLSRCVTSPPPPAPPAPTLEARVAKLEGGINALDRAIDRLTGRLTSRIAALECRKL